MMTRATSSGVPARFNGRLPTKPALASSLPAKRSSMPVAIGPGAIAVTRTPNVDASSAAALVNPSTGIVNLADPERLFPARSA